MELKEMLEKRESLSKELRRMKMEAMLLIRSILDKERKIFIIGNTEKTESFEEILKEYEKISKNIKKIERRIETNVLGRKEEEKLTKILYDLIKKEEILKEKLKKAKKIRELTEERKALLSAIKIEKRSFFDKIKKIRKLKKEIKAIDEKIRKKERMLKGITVYKEKINISEIEEKYKKLLEKVKNNRKLNLNDLILLEEYERLLKCHGLL